MHLELYIVSCYDHNCNSQVTSVLWSFSQSAGKWWKEGQGNENYLRRRLHFRCLKRCARAYFKTFLPPHLPGRSACIHALSYLQTCWGTCGKYDSLHHEAVKLQHIWAVTHVWEHGLDLADSWDLSTSDVVNGMETQTNLRASLCLLFGLSSLGFECFLLSRSGWELTMQIAIALSLPAAPPPLD